MEIFKRITDYLNNNPWLNVIFLALALLSIIVSIILYIKSKKSRIPTYSVRSVNLIKENIKKIKSVEILYEGKKVENLTITKLALWNAGKETIDSKDVAQVNPIKIILKNGAKILDSEIIFQKNPSNNFTINIDRTTNEIHVIFDYFDLEEGVIIQMYHTGISSADIEITGTIKATNSIQRKRISTISRIPLPIPSSLSKKLLKNISRRTLKNTLGIALILSSILLSFLLLFSNESNRIEPTPLWGKIIILLFFFFTYGGAGILLLIRRIPKGFDAFEEEF